METMSLGYHNLQKLVVTVNFSIKKPVYEYVKKTILNNFSANTHVWKHLMCHGFYHTTIYIANGGHHIQIFE